MIRTSRLLSEVFRDTKELCDQFRAESVEFARKLHKAQARAGNGGQS